MASRMSKKEWKILGAIIALIDLLQLILDIFAVGVVVNEIIDIIVGFSLPFYFQIRGVSMFNPKRLAAFLAVFVGEAIPVANGLPLWTLDVYVTYLTVKGEEVLVEKAPDIAHNIQRYQGATQRLSPKYQNGVRMPNPRSERASTPPPIPPSSH